MSASLWPPRPFDEEIARPVINRAIDYPDGHVVAAHSHRRHQLLYGASGVVMVTTHDGTWVMPPQRGMWICAGVVHDVRMLGTVSMRSLYFEPDSIDGMPEHCRVVAVSPFMRGLLAETAHLPALYPLGGRDEALMTLILHEAQRMPAVPLSLQFPAHEAMARRCRDFLDRPDPHVSIEDWCVALAMSRRGFTRLFRQETGLSFAAWRQQACLVAALPRLAAGEPVTAVALDIGYDNPAAFTAMFKRLLGLSPRAYLGRRD